MKHQNLPASDGADAQSVTELVLTVFRLNGALLQWGDALVAPLGLTSARWQMLGAVALGGKSLTAPQIAQAMGVTRQGAQKQLNLLVEQGLLALHPNPAHSRSPLYALTPQGVQVYGQADALWLQQASAMGARITVAQARAAQSALEAMLSHLSHASSLEAAP